MKRNFEKEYQEYMKTNTPDLWERIEAGLKDREFTSEEASAKKDSALETDSPESGQQPKPAEKKKGIYWRHRTLARILPAAACICILAAAMLMPGLRERNAARPDRLEQPNGTLSQTMSTTGTGESDAQTNPDKAEQFKAEPAEVELAKAEQVEAEPAKAEQVEAEPAEAGQNEEVQADVFEEEVFEDGTADQSAYAQGPDLAAVVGGEAGEMAEEAFEFEDIGIWEEMPVDTGTGYAIAGITEESDADIAPTQYGTESYSPVDESGFSLVSVQPVSTFSADVDTASYANVRRMIEDGWSLGSIYPDAVRIEEFINYFHYDLNPPEGESPFGVTTEIASCPWNEEHQLLMVGLCTEKIDLAEAPAENLVFLLDVSGSMADEDKLPLLQRAFAELTEQLDAEDTVSIVTYANDVEVVLEGAGGNEKQKILDAVEGLSPEGGTYGEGGIQKAYALAERYYLPEGNNRILLATDGDLNIGISEPDELEKLIREKKKSGVYLSVLGFGTGNVRDDNMERLADCGNGNYSYIDSILEARKVLVEELGATFHTVAEDVKLQIEFNPETVNAYRQLGYENRQLNAVDFADDTKDAGEIGAGHSMVVLYELIPAGSAQAVELKYSSGNKAAEKSEAEEEEDSKAGSDYADEYATLKIRYKEPGQMKSEETETVIDKSAVTDTPDDDFIFASLAAEFAMVLRDSPNKGTSSLDGILKACADLDLKDEYRQEFYYLVRLLAKREA